MRELLITKKDENQRIDKFLFKYLNNAPKSFVYKMIRKKNIKLNNKKVSGNEMLFDNDKIQLYFSDTFFDNFTKEKEINLNAGLINIIYEDENVLIINKPSGVLSHPDTKNDKDSAIDRILNYLHLSGSYDISAESTFTPALCNRLDRNTSGILICGKNLNSLQELNKIMLNNEIDKIYMTIVSGVGLKDGVLTGYHYKNNEQNKVYISDKPVEGSKKVIMKYSCTDDNKKYSKLKINLITGKSHQIRAQLSDLGYPIIGDKKYGTKENNKWVYEEFGLSNHLLHASEVRFKTYGKLEYLNDIKLIGDFPETFQKINNNMFL